MRARVLLFFEGATMRRIFLTVFLSLFPTFISAQGTDILSWPHGDLVEDPLYAYAWCTSVTVIETDSVFDAFPYIHLWYPFSATSLIFRTAAQVKEQMDRMPEGHRVMFIWLLDRFMADCSNYRSETSTHPSRNCPEAEGKRDGTMVIDPASGDTLWVSSLWWDNGVAWMQGLLDGFLREYKSIGGALDVFTLDTEKYMSLYQIASSRNDSLHRAIWRAIDADSRLAGIHFMDSLHASGFAPAEADMYGSVLFRDQHSFWLPESRDNHHVYLAVAKRRAARYHNTAMYDVVRRHYPDVKFSNYNFYLLGDEHYVVPAAGSPLRPVGNGSIVGNRQSRSLYSPYFSSSYPAELPKENTPFNGFRYDVNRMRAMYLTAPDVPIHPWLPWKWYGATSNLLYDHNLYFEKVIHVAMTNADALLYWFNQSLPESVNRSHPLLSAIMDEWNLVLGYDGRRPLTVELSDWHTNAVVTGMSIGDVNIWRFTPNPDSTTIVHSAGKVDGSSDVVITTGVEEYRFAEATVHTVRTSIADMGLWIVQQRTANSVGSTVSRPGATSWPNPATTSVTLNFGDAESDMEYLVTDMLGRALLRGWLRGGRGVVDVSQLRAGVYTVIPLGNGFAPLRILKQ
jgi:hypothetical protein